MIINFSRVYIRNQTSNQRLAKITSRGRQIGEYVAEKYFMK